MRKVLWFCAGFAVLLTVGVFLAADYVHRHPASMLGRAVVTLYQTAVTRNPAFGGSEAKPLATAQAFDEPTPEQIEQVRQVVAEAMRTELPPIQLLGTITIPEGIETAEVVVPGEEISELPLVEPGVVEAPLTMPYLHEQVAQCPYHGCTWNGSGPFVRVKCPCETTLSEMECGPCETTLAEMTAVSGPCETTAAEMGKVVVGKCETTDDEVLEMLFGTGEELSEPVDEPAPKKPDAIKMLNARPKLKRPAGLAPKAAGSDTLELRPGDLQPY